MNPVSMPRAHVIAAVIAIVLAAGAGGYWLAAHGRNGPAAMPASGRNILYWHDPMKPDVRFDKPGKSPFMDMQLVPVYADEGVDGAVDGAVRISPNVTQNLGIRIGRTERVALDRTLFAIGSVAFDENLLAVVPARVEGYVTRLYVRTPLEHVRRGQTLAEIQAPAWLEAQQEYLALLDSRSDVAHGLRDAARQRLRVLGVPETTIELIEAERKAFLTTKISSPIDGVVSELAVREGTAFMPGAPLFRINGLTTVWVNARIPEVQVSRVAPGSRVTASATAWPGASFEGRVAALLPEVDEQTRTLTARIQLANRDQRLAPGMFVSLRFATSASEPQLVVPSEAVIATGKRTVVIVRNDDGSFSVTPVTAGEELEGRVAILGGLTEGQAIVLSGQFLIDSEASLRATVSRLGDSADEKHNP